MAFISLFEYPEVQEILRLLEIKEEMTRKLNQEVVLQKRLCSTSTLYRRLKELIVSGMIERNGEYYTLTEFGRQTFKEYLRNSLNYLSKRDIDILTFVHRNNIISASDLRSIIRISPNDLQDRINKLLEEELLEQIQKYTGEKKGRGRPRKYYKLSTKGVRVVRRFENYFRKYSYKEK